MNKMLPIVMLFACLSNSFGAELEEDKNITLNFNTSYHVGDYCNDNMELDIDDEDIIIRSKDTRDVVVFSSDYDLFINDEMVELNVKQQELVQEYHELTMELVNEAKKIGLEGAKIGAKGAALGLTAAASVFKLLLPGYDGDDFEREIEEKAENLEIEAEKIEIKAEELEVMADHLDDLQYELKDKIPELDELDWF